MNTKSLIILASYIFRPKLKKDYYVPGSLVISYCGTHINKVSEILDSHLKPVMQNDLSYKEIQQTFLKRSKVLVKFLKMRYQ